MDRADLDRLERLNQALLAENFANAMAPSHPVAIASVGFFSGIIGFGVLFSALKWLGVASMEMVHRDLLRFRCG